jgi:hypothetical protein
VTSSTEQHALKGADGEQRPAGRPGVPRPPTRRRLDITGLITGYGVLIFLVVMIVVFCLVLPETRPWTTSRRSWPTSRSR